MAEEIVFDVKSNVKSVTKDNKELVKSVVDAETEYKNLNEQMSIQKEVITDLEKDLVLMKAQLRDTPMTGAAGFYALEEAIEKANDELKLEKIGLTEIKNQIDDNRDSVKDLDKATKTGSKGFKGLATAAKGFGLALKAAGIGLIIAAFAALKEALERNQTVMNTVNTIMTTVSTTFNQVVGVLIDVYDWVTKSTERFDGLTKVITGLMTIALTPLKLSFYAIQLAVQKAQLAWEDSFFGGGDVEKMTELRISIGETITDIENTGKAALDAGSSIITNFGDAIGEIGSIYEKAAEGITDISIKGNFEQAKATTTAANAAKLAEAQIQGLIEKNDLLSETQRQIRDDETKTFADRIEANNELARILDEQEKQMLSLADTRVAAAKLELDANKENIDLQVAYQQTLNDRAGVEAQVAGFRSEQMTNQVSLEKELLETQNQLAAEGLNGIERELLELENSYKEKVKMAEKSGTDITELTKQYEKEKSQVVQAGINDQLDAYSSLASALSSLAGENKALAVASAVIDTYVGANKALAQGGALGFISAAAVIASGLNNVRTILSTEVAGESGGGSAPTTNSQTPAPQMLSGKFELGNVQEQQPVQAYVVTDNLTDNQNKLAYIRRRATI
tara:strand:- start:177 stop:2048 length:1872 start_codon:yes stop_codon:yes gene_type:complete